ncbi:MAG: YggT family protein [Thiobacillaceae bacterium]
MLAGVLSFLIQTLGNLMAIAFLLRFVMQALRVPFTNPFAQFVMAVTDFAVRPLRRLIAGWGGLDWASLFLAWLMVFVVTISLRWLSGFPFSLVGGGVWLALAGLAVVELVKLAIYLLIGLVVIRAVLSWINPYSPLSPVMYPLTEPFLRPLRQVLPEVGGVDLSPLVLILLAQLVIMVPLTLLEGALRSLF